MSYIFYTPIFFFFVSFAVRVPFCSLLLRSVVSTQWLCAVKVKMAKTWKLKTMLATLKGNVESKEYCTKAVT